MYELSNVLGGVLMGSVIIVPFIIAAILISSVPLWIATQILKFKKQEIKTALIVTGIWCAILSPLMLLAYFLPGIGVISRLDGLIGTILLLIGVIFAIVIFIYLIKRFYEVGWKEAIRAWLIVIGIGVAVRILMFILRIFS